MVSKWKRFECWMGNHFKIVWSLISRRGSLKMKCLCIGILMTRLLNWFFSIFIFSAESELWACDAHHHPFSGHACSPAAFFPRPAALRAFCFPSRAGCAWAYPLSDSSPGRSQNGKATSLLLMLMGHCQMSIEFIWVRCNSFSVLARVSFLICCKLCTVVMESVSGLFLMKMTLILENFTVESRLLHHPPDAIGPNNT